MANLVGNFVSKLVLNDVFLQKCLMDKTNKFSSISFTDEYAEDSEYVLINRLASQDLNEIISHWKIPKPKLIINVLGGTNSDGLTSKLKRSVREGLTKAAAYGQAITLTDGLNFGISRHVGRGKRDFSHTCVSKYDPPLIGFINANNTFLGLELLHHSEKNVSLSTKGLHVNKKPFAYKTGSDALEAQHTGFFLYENCNVIDRRYQVMRKMQCMWNISSVMVLVGGHENLYKNIFRQLSNGTPLVVLRKSGGISDIIAKAFTQANQPDMVGIEKEKNCLDVQAILNFKELIVVHDDSKSDSFEYSIFRAVIQKQISFCNGSCSEQKLLEMQLSLALDFDQYEFAYNEILQSGRMTITETKSHRKCLENALKLNNSSFFGVLTTDDYNIRECVNVGFLNRIYKAVDINDEWCFLRKLGYNVSDSSGVVIDGEDKYIKGG